MLLTRLKNGLLNIWRYHAPVVKSPLKTIKRIHVCNDDDNNDVNLIFIAGFQNTLRNIQRIPYIFKDTAFKT